jgi:aspartate dehydrogenase
MGVGPLRVGLIGLGTIGGSVVRLVAQHAPDEIVFVGALVHDDGREREPGLPSIFASADALLAAGPDVVVEAGGHEALAQHGPAILRGGCDLVMVSVGALARPEVHAALSAAAQAGGGRAIVASGAVGALDAISAAALGGLDRVTHTTRKPPHTLLAADDAAKLSEACEVFRGSAREGALRFPESINVAAAVALAGIGLDRTEVCVIADPAVTRNQHEIVAEGAFGRLRFAIENVPSESNPKTGRLVALSLVQTLLRRRAAVVIG